MNRRIGIIGDIMYRKGKALSSKISIISAFGDIAYIDVSKNEKYDAIITGYMGDAKKILDTREYICDMKLDNPNTFVLVDPVFADDGEIYDGITDEHINNYKKLIEIADLVTPNLSEACYITNSSYEEYRDKYITVKYENDDKEKVDELSKKIIVSIYPLFDKLRIKKNQATIVTGVELYNSILTVLDIYDGDHAKRQTTCNYSEKIEDRFGAGDIFDAMYLEACMAGFNLADALSVVTSYINNSLRFSRDQKYDKAEGIIHEPILYENVIAIKNKINELKKIKKEKE